MKKELCLITDCWGTASFQLCEGKLGNDGRITFRGPFTESDRPNRNRRIYPEHVLKPEFNRLALIAERKGLLGELDHPADSTLHLERASHVIRNLWWEKPKVGYGEARTIPTPGGYILEALFHEGVPIGISSRGVGNGHSNNEGYMVIEGGFRMITFDTVADPSYQDAWQTIKEGVLDDIKTGRIKRSMATPELMEQNYQGIANATTDAHIKRLEKLIKEGDASCNGSVSPVSKEGVVQDVNGFIHAINQLANDVIS